MSSISREQICDLLNGHCHRVLSSMQYDDLLSYAMQMMSISFDKNPGQGDTDVNALVNDIIDAEDGDGDSAYEFIVGSGIDADSAQHLIDQSQSN